MIPSLSDWFKDLAPFFQPIRSETKTNRSRVQIFPRCRLRVIASSFDWFTGLSPSFLIGQSNYFGFGFTTLDWNLLYFPLFFAFHKHVDAEVQIPINGFFLCLIYEIFV